MKVRRSHFLLVIVGLAVLALTGVQPASAYIKGRSGVSDPPAQTAPIINRGSSSAVAPARTPLLFVPNVGQFDPQVRFQMRGAGGTWWFTDRGVWLSVIRPLEQARRLPGLAFLAANPDASALRPLAGTNLRLTLAGMSPGARFVGAKPQSTRINYFSGNDPLQWRSNVPTYGALRWEGVYPGVDLVFGETKQGFEITVDAPAEVNLAALRLVVDGTEELRTDAAGRLVAESAGIGIVLPALVNRQGIALTLAPNGDAVLVDLHTGAGSPLGRKQLLPVNDPTDLLYSTFIGGFGDDTVQSVKVGNDGSLYLAGFTDSSNYPTTPGGFDQTYNGGYDVLVTKLNPSGTGLVYSTYLGGNSTDSYGLIGIAIDASGDAYIGGWTSSSDFPTTSNAFDRSYNGGGDAFLTELNATGTELIYSSFFGGTGLDRAEVLAVGEDGTAFVTGYTESGDFPTKSGAYDTTYNGGGDAFAAHLSLTGAGLLYSTFLGGTGKDRSIGISLGSDGTAYLGGYTNSSGFPTTAGALDTSYNGGTNYGDAFVTHLNASGSGLLWSTFIGGKADDYGAATMLGSDGTVYLAGTTYSSDFPTTAGAFSTVCGGCPSYSDLFVGRLSSDGSRLVYSTYLGGSHSDFDLSAGTGGIDLGPDGSAYIGGATSSSDFPSTPGAFDTTFNGGGDDGILAQLSADGSRLLYSTYLGGSGLDDGHALAVDSTGVAYLGVGTGSSDYPVTAGAYDTSFNGYYDVAISKLVPNTIKPTMHVASIDPSYTQIGSKYQVNAQVTIQATNSAPVAGATVVVGVTLPGGELLGFTGTTNASGVATLSFITSKTGTFHFTVRKVSARGWVYDASQNAETKDSLTIP